MGIDDDPTQDDLVMRLLARGVPWHLAVEAVASTALDRDETVGTHEFTPKWLQEHEDGLRIVDRD